MTSQFPDRPQALPQVQKEPLLKPDLVHRLPGWRLWLPLLLQTGLILAVPAQDAYTYTTGREITLQTAPVDPYDFLRGHYQVLSYEISQFDQLNKLPGGSGFGSDFNRPKTFYVVLAAPEQTNQTPPQPWKPVRISATRPTDLTDQQVALQGKIDNYGRITYGLETYYMPEDQRNQVNQTISQQTDQRAFVVNVKVDATGNAVPISLWVGQQNYRF
jgi:uncharacterized membrane-anchored protein